MFVHSVPILKSVNSLSSSVNRLVCPTFAKYLGQIAWCQAKMNSTLLSVQYISYSIISLVLQRDLLHKSIAKRNEWSNSYHYIVVGSGSAGAIVAARLAEDPRVRVLLLEAGGAQSLRTDMPPLYPSFLGTDYDWNYMSEPQKYMGLAYVDKRQTEPRGMSASSRSSGDGCLIREGNRWHIHNKLHGLQSRQSSRL